MREIKFRAWDKKWNRWILPDDIIVLGDGTADFERRGEDGHPIEIAELKHGEIELMQYTGLKDAKGKEIYEGDVVRFVVLRTPAIEVVEWLDGAAGWEPFIDPDDLYDSATVPRAEDCEVIGNRFENPELVEEAP